MLNLRRVSVALFGLAALTVMAPANAQSFVFEGNLPQGDAVAFYDFTVSAPTSEFWVLSTTSYSTGGFDPVLTLFEKNGVFLADNDDSPFVPGPLPAPSEFDSYLWVELDPGQYTLAVSQTGNFSGIGSTANDPFDGVGQVNGFGGRTSAFRVVGNAVPEPGTLALMLAGIAPATLLMRRRRNR